jgi:type IV secretory pathway component VirB8
MSRFARFRFSLRRRKTGSGIVSDDSEPIGETWPGEKDSGHTHRQYIWTARWFAVIAAISLSGNVVLAGAVAALVPNYKVYPLFLTLSPKDDLVYSIQPVRQDLPVVKVMLSFWVREWVEERNIVHPDQGDMAKRLKFLAERSSPVVIQDLRSETNQNFVRQAIQRKLTRETKVISVTNPVPGYYVVDFATTDYIGTAKVQEGQWRAQLRIALRKVELTKTDLDNIDDEPYLNPFGFTVIDYTVNPA